MPPSSPRLVVDARMVGRTLHGIARYVTLASRGLEEKRAADPASVPFEPWYLIDPDLNPLPDPRSFPPERVRWVPASFLSPQELWMVPRAVHGLDAAAFWSPSFASFPWLPCPWFVTIHDLNHLQYGNRLKQLYYGRLLKPFARRAQAVLTVSEFSQHEIAQWLGVPTNRVEVVPNAIDPALWEGANSQRPPDIPAAPYFLCLGSNKPHKNIARLLAAYRAWRRNRIDESTPNCDLVISGVDPPPAEPIDAGIHYVEYIPESDLGHWIRGAVALVVPSLYEGFGLPPVESAALGTPVIASKIPAHFEVLQGFGAAVTWVDPMSAVSISEGLEQVAHDPLLRERAAALQTMARERYSVRELANSICQAAEVTLHARFADRLDQGFADSQ